MSSKINKIAIRFGYFLMCNGGYIGGKYYKTHSPDTELKLRCQYCNKYKRFIKI